MARARMGVIGTGWWATQAHIPSLRAYEKADLVGVTVESRGFEIHGDTALSSKSVTELPGSAPIHDQLDCHLDASFGLFDDVRKRNRYFICPSLACRIMLRQL